MIETPAGTETVATLCVVDMGIDTHQEPVVYMRRDCHICRSEGFTASTRVLIEAATHSVIATLNIVENEVLEEGRAGFSRIAMQRLKVMPGDRVSIVHAPTVQSLSLLRKKVFGDALSDDELYAVVADISAHRYSDIEISCFLSACAGGRLSSVEIVGLTRAMVRCGHQLAWPGRERVFDKHCIGGLPGNRTTPLVVSIAGAAGLIMPKTSSRAITSPAGTADAMETLAKVDLSLAEIKRVVAETGVCLAWGGAVELSPADDLLIRIERALDLDGEGQLIASVLSKKIAAGSTHAIIDIPVGAKAKVRSSAEGERLAALFTDVGAACGIRVRCIMTDGSRPIGFGIGPVEEARDFLAVLRCEADAPQDLRARALLLAGNLLDLAFDCGVPAGIERATAILDSGQAYTKFEQVVTCQGGFKALPTAAFSHIETAVSAGCITAIDNRQLARLAKLAGAPSSPAAGLRLHVNVGSRVEQGQPLFTLLSDSAGECEYAMHYYHNDANIFLLEPLS